MPVTPFQKRLYLLTSLFPLFFFNPFLLVFLFEIYSKPLSLGSPPSRASSPFVLPFCTGPPLFICLFKTQRPLFFLVQFPFVSMVLYPFPHPPLPSKPCDPPRIQSIRQLIFLSCLLFGVFSFQAYFFLALSPHFKHFLPLTPLALYFLCAPT